MALRHRSRAPPHDQIVDVLHAAGPKGRLYPFTGLRVAHVVHQRPCIALEQIRAWRGARPAAKVVAVGVKARRQGRDRRVRQRALYLGGAHQHRGQGSCSQQEERKFHRIGIGAGSRRPLFIDGKPVLAITNTTKTGMPI
ncbi:hypothetical protein [Cupriavidus sp. H18C1]|uniref:hypothetical protein n=1 Tax=Cupriavidus sp. H18C1 TaxID=3241601 RepID=UPI003BB8ECFD